MKTTDPVIIVEATLSSPRSVLWNAITDHEQMIQWFFEQIPSFEPRAGFETEFSVTSQEREFIHKWKILDVVDQERIVYDWSYEKWAGRGTVIFELLESGDHTVLRLTNDVLEDFDSTVPEFNRESCIAGWEYFLQGRLKSFLDQEDNA